ncbi:hypothetical protein D9M71_783050 [compost metagenome]
MWSARYATMGVIAQLRSASSGRSVENMLNAWVRLLLLCGMVIHLGLPSNIPEVARRIPSAGEKVVCTPGSSRRRALRRSASISEAN